MSRTPWASSAVAARAFGLGQAADSITIALMDKSLPVTAGHVGNSWTVSIEAKIEGIWAAVGSVRSTGTAPRSRTVAIATAPGASDWRAEVRYAGAAATPPVEAAVYLSGCAAPLGTGAGLVPILGSSTPVASTTREVDADSAAAATSLVVATSAGRLLEISGENLTGGALYVHWIDAAAVPANGTAITRLPIVVNANSSFRRIWQRPWRFSTGMVLVGSSTSTTLTASVNSFWFSAQAEVG